MLRITLSFFLLLLGTFLLSSEKVTKWKLLYEKHGVEVFTAEISGSEFVAFKGMVTVDVSPPVVIDVFKDHRRWEEWTDLLIDGKLLSPTRKNTLVFYQAFKSPPFVADRDAVYEVKFEGPGNNGVMKVIGVSRDHPNSPDTVGVRMKIDFSKWILTPKDGRTIVELEMHADPGGWIPSWLVNMVQRSYPYDLLSSLRDHINLVVSERAKD